MVCCIPRATGSLVRSCPIERQLHLDSGTGAERFDAHRLYHSHGLAIHSHHFARGL